MTPQPMAANEALADSPTVAPGRWMPALNRLAVTLTRVALAGAVVILLLLPPLAYLWTRRPFMGAFVEPTLVFNGVGPRGGRPWSGIEAGLRFPYQLRAVNAQPVHNVADLTRVLSAYRPGDAVTLTYRADDGVERQARVTLQSFPAEDLTAYFIVPYLVGLAFLLIGLLVFRLRREEPAGRALALFCAAMAVTVNALFDVYTTHVFAWAWTMAIPLAGAGLTTLALVFPQELSLARRYPYLVWAGVTPALVLAGLGEWALFDARRPTAYAAMWRNEYAFAGACLVVFLGLMLYRSVRSPSPIAREQARIILGGSLLAFGPIGYYLALTTAGLPTVFNVSLYFPPLALFPLAAGYAILRYRLLNTDAVIRRGWLYAAMGILATLVYTALVTWAAIRTEGAARADDPFLIALLVFILVVAFNPLRERLQRWLDAQFYRGSRAYREHLQEFGRDLTKAADLEQLVLALRRQIEAVVRPAHAHIFLREAGGRYFAAYRPADPAFAGLRLSAAGGLAQALTAEHGPLYLIPDAPLPSTLAGDRRPLEAMGAQLIIPFPGNAGLAGWVALSPKRSGEPYTRDDLHFLESIGSQTALAIERVQLYEETRRRAQHLTILNDLAREMTGALDLRDLCELVAQRLCTTFGYFNVGVFTVDAAARQIVLESVRGKYQTIAQPGAYRQAFGEGVIGKAAAVGRRFVVNDTRQQPGFYELDGMQILSELAIPLKVGDHVIGVLNVDSDRANAFDDSDIATLTTVADQLAVALEKARLFAQAEQRAAQLSTLNEIGRAVSTLMDVPTVLEVIYQQIQRSLPLDVLIVSLYDARSGQISYPLVYDGGRRYTEAPEPLTNDTNLGRAIRSAAPVLINRTPEELAAMARPAQPVGDSSRPSASLLYTPLVVGAHVIGAISAQSYTVNAYHQEHQNILTGVAHQAAIAIENARLFEAERAQRTLSEALRDTASALNSTFNFTEVLDSILTNLGRVVPHDAASIMLIESGAAYSVRRRGYTAPGQESAARALRVQVAELPSMRRMAETGQPIVIADTEGHPDWVDFPETHWVRSYASAPIRRKGGEVIGFLNLNSLTPGFFTAVHARHLLAFADQAGIAIENARLFDDLQRSSAELELAYLATLEGWSRALELRDQDTEGHTQRVAALAMQLAGAFSLSKTALTHIYRGALLHDIGKMGIPDAILLKPGPLTPAERNIMCKHPSYAYEMLSPIDYLRPALDIPYAHHEKWDGTGYPRGLRGEAIPLAARIFAIADVWDALCSDRPYRKAWRLEQVREHIRSLSGTHFDPQVVEVFLEMMGGQ